MKTAIGNIWTIAKRELQGYFTSPVAYVIIVIFLMLSAGFAFFLGGFFERKDASLVSFFMWHPWLYLFLVPAVGMRLWSEERRSGTIELLLTMPITPSQAIVGKYIASWIFLTVALLLTFPIWITINFLGNPDNGAVLCGYVGSALVAGAYLAIASMTSAMTRNQVISFIVSVVFCVSLALVGFLADSPAARRFLASLRMEWAAGFAAAFGVVQHYETFQRGVIDLRDLVFFASIVLFGLFTTGVIIRSHRAG